MKTIIFGAGASYDSIYEYYSTELDKFIEINGFLKHPCTPPLANQLFSTRPEIQKIINTFPGAKSQQDTLNRISDIEKYLGELYDDYLNHNDNIVQRNFINIQFYLQKLMFEFSTNIFTTGLSNYQDLINRTHRYCIKNNTSVGMISFNYDLLLELYISKHYGLDDFNVEDYLKHPIKLFKPHGSANWIKFFNVPLNIVESRMSVFHYKYPEFSRVNGVENSINIHMQPDSIISNQGNVTPYIPMIAVPTYGKDSLLLSEEMLESLKTHLRNTTEILVIGWRASENIFLQLLNDCLKSTEVKITIVDPYPLVTRDNLKLVLPAAIFSNTESIINEDIFEDFRQRSPYASFTRYSNAVNDGKVESFFD